MTDSEQHLERELRRVTHRVRYLERSLLLATGGASAVLLLVGVVRHYATWSVAEEVEEHSMLALAFAGFVWRTEDGRVDSESVFFSAAFLLLLVVTAVWLAALPGVVERSHGDRMALVTQAASVLVLLAALGAWMVLGMGSGSSDSSFEMGTAVWWYSAGAALALVTSHGLKTLWHPELRTDR